MNVKNINCPLCGCEESTRWAEENGYVAVKCAGCGLVYVNPRPSDDLIASGVETGEHSEVEGMRHARARRVPGKVSRYRKLLETEYPDIWCKKEPIRWLDVGAGYGEVIEAVSSLAPSGSIVEGVEPMAYKAQEARKLGIEVREGYIEECQRTYDFVSVFNVFSHIPDFRSFLEGTKQVLSSEGELIMQTGNIGDLKSPSEVPSNLNLPDHLVFAGEKNLIEFLTQSGFVVTKITRKRSDNFLRFVKNFVKKILGRRTNVILPYTSDYRSLIIRAKRIPGR